MTVSKKDGGVFAVARGLFDHPIFAREPFTEREAWIWMCGEAAYEERRVRIGRSIVTLGRGQFSHAMRFMGRRWGWSEARVRRFLVRLEIDAMVVVQPTRDSTHITICNYDRYAFKRRISDAQIDAQTDGLATDRRRKEKEREEGEEVNAADAAPVSSHQEVDFYRRGKEVCGKSAGGLLTQLLKAKKGSFAQARAAIEVASEKENPREYIGAIIRGRDSPEDLRARGEAW